MLEIPEAYVIAVQLENQVCGREVASVTMNSAPHKFAFYTDDPLKYRAILQGAKFETATAYGGMVELVAHDLKLVFSDGVNLRFHESSDPRPQKHQLLIEFTDGTALSGSVQMYGGLWCFKEGTFENEYRTAALEKPSPLTPAFDPTYFQSLIELDSVQKLSTKAFLATEQRIPGLGNGVLQDVLWTAHIHPKRKIQTLNLNEREVLFQSIKLLLSEMAAKGGRDTEKDLFGHSGGYYTHLSKLHASDGCPVCGGGITKEAYMGGSIYYCPTCQKL
ncbi:endonuclease VIII [Acidaminobacter sp.]|uniref:endonuclease VIII n=1 Tax=Acidaminobacter sp. TaxID=1872102 RepID=UPI0013826241|nr:endonuclease VIII [Acidaminobacter sp.]MDK9711061.1 endonuclease VIII [Acidaminobacter sp.]MZQ96313.1 endonuclease VIII [Acidaminobacter sp.]